AAETGVSHSRNTSSTARAAHSLVLRISSVTSLWGGGFRKPPKYNGSRVGRGVGAGGKRQDMILPSHADFPVLPGVCRGFLEKFVHLRRRVVPRGENQGVIGVGLEAGKDLDGVCHFREIERSGWMACKIVRLQEVGKLAEHHIAIHMVAVEKAVGVG